MKGQSSTLVERADKGGADVAPLEEQSTAIEIEPLTNSERAGRQMSFVQVKLIEENCTPTDKTEIGITPSWAWADIEDILSAEWEIGGSALPTDAIRALVAGE